jgi:hypothetical protein
MFTLLKEVWTILTRAGCQHRWRPALSNGKAAKHCPLCKNTVELTESEFYAVFGRTHHSEPAMEKDPKR